MKKHPFSALPNSTYMDKSVHSTDGEVAEHKCLRGRRKSGSKKHRAGKNPHRKYKPYHKLTSAEREKVEERISRRSSLKRAFLRSRGVALAPLNTTQFLVNDSLEASGLLKKWKDREDSADASSASEFQEMSDFYEHLSHTDLVGYYYYLEGEVARMKEDLAVVEQKIRDFEGEVRWYERENEDLKKLNEKVIKMVKDLQLEDELAKILKENPDYGEKCQHLEEEGSPSKDGVPEIPKDFPVEDDKVIDVKDLHPEEGGSHSKDELPQMPKDFPRCL